MANICNDFRRALDNTLAVTEFSDVFSIGTDGKIVKDGEALKGLSIKLLTQTGQLPSSINDFIDIVTDNFEDENLNTEQLSEVASLILKDYNRLKYLRRELRPNRENKLPRLTDSLTNNFLGDNTLKLFSKWFNTNLVNVAVLLQPGRMVKSTVDLNFSIQRLKQKYVDNIVKYLETDGFSIYKDLGTKGSELQIIPYNLLLEAAQNRFSERLVDGKYKSNNNPVEDDAYYSFYSLVNFDKLITNPNFSEIVGISRTGLNLKGSNTVPLYNIPKYEFAFQQVPAQKWDEDLSKESDEVNPLVRKFLENTNLYDRDSKGVYTIVPNQYLSYRNFKEVLRILKENPITRNDYARLRDDTYSIESLFEKADRYRKTIFSGKQKHVRRMFDTMYYKIFSLKTPSLAAASLNSNMVSAEFDVYGMILNQINKTSFTTYTQYIYDFANKTNRAVILDSSDIDRKKYTIERNIMANSLYRDSRLNALKKWNVNFLSENGTSLNYYSDNISDPLNLNKITLGNNDDILTIDFSDPNNPTYMVNGAKIVKSSLSPDSGFMKMLEGLLTDFGYIHADDIYVNILSQIIDSDAKLNGVLDVITASLLNMNISDNLANSPNIRTALNLYPNLELSDSTTSPWKYFNIETKSLKMSGYFSALNGLESLAVVQSIINGDSSKSNVTDANGNKLQKERLTNLTNDDYYYFEALLNKISDNILDDDVVKYNLFTSNGTTEDSRLLLRTELKTFYNSFYNSTPKKINTATDSETNYLFFVHDFLTREDEVSVQPTVYSDKSTIWNKVISTNTPLEASWIPDHLKGKTLQEMTPDQVREVKYESTKRMANVFVNRVLSDYQALVKTGVFGDVEELTSEYNLDTDNIINKYENYLSLFREKADGKLIEDALRYLKHTTGEMVTIIDQIHWLPGFKVNPALYDFFKMYSNDNIEKYNSRENLNKGFYALKLQDSTKIELSYNNGREITEIKDGIKFHLEKMNLNYDSYVDNWVNKDTNELILFKASKNGTSIDYITQDDVLSPDFKIELNPLLDKFLSLDNLIASNYNSLVYGLPFIHPAKGATSKSLADTKLKKGETPSRSDFFKFSDSSIIQEDAARTNASYKRAVIGGATIHTWLKNKLNGVPNKLKLSVIEDPIDYVGNIHGDIDKVTMYDGGIWMNPFQAIWEKNSVEEVKQSSIHRKPIGYFSLANYLSSGLMKCATFSVNNTIIRNSLGKNSAEGMLKKMSDENWIVPIKLNINHLKSKLKLNSSSVHLKDAKNTLLNPRYKETIVENGVQKVVIKEVKDIIYNGSNISEDGKINNMYDLAITTYDLNGNILSNDIVQNVNINSNYTLWKALGGEKSIAYNNEYDESSIETVANLASNLNIEKTKAIESLMELTTKLPLEFIAKFPKFSDGYIKKIRNSGKFFQPLKLSDVSYLANHSAIKNGAINLLDTSNYYNNLDLTYVEIDPDFIGIQMSAEHHAENSEVSEMTQVMSALIQKGISYETTLAVYRDLGSYIAKGLEPFMNVNNNQLIVTLGKQLLQSFSTDDLSAENLASRYIKLIKDDLLENNAEKEILVPFDDPNIFSKFVIDFANNLNQNIIRRKFFGLNAVLNPSHDVVGLIEYTDENGNTQLYTREDYENKNGVVPISNIPNTLVDPGQVLNGDWIMDDGVEKQVTFKPLKDGRQHISLQDLRDKYRQLGRKVEKINRYGRNLRPHNYTFNLGERGTYDGFDMDSSKLSYSLSRTLGKIKSVSSSGEINTDVPKDLDVLRLSKFINFVKNKESLYTGSEEAIIDHINKAIEGNEESLKKLGLTIKEWIISDCKRIQYNHEYPSLVEWSGSNLEYLPLDGEISYSANEMLLPKVWASKFMLKEGDNLSSVLEDPVTFFKTKLYDTFDYSDLNDFKPDKAFAALKGLNSSNNLYVIMDEDFDKSGWTLYRPETTVLNNKVFVLDSNGEPLYPIKKGIQLYTKVQYGEPIVAAVLDDPANLNYLENSSTFSETVVYRVNRDDIANTIKKSKLASDSVINLLYSEELPSDEDLEGIYEAPEAAIERKANKMAISFRNMALNFIVARIPAQSMQSFMNMTIKGFINTDSNVVYICADQLWLQGSDYDIDKAFILGASIDEDGTFIDWSPYFDYTNVETFKESLKLPLPTGKPIKFSKDPNAVDITELYEQYENSDNMQDLIALLATVSSGDPITIDENYKESARTVIDHHNLYHLDDEYRVQEGIKNKVFSEMWEVGTNYANMVSQTSPISIEDGQKAAEHAESFSKYINNNNPAAKAIAQFQNSIGKDGIGIAATGIKVYSNTLTYVHSKLYSQKDWTAQKWIDTINEIKGKPIVDISGLDLKGGYLNIIPNVNYDNLSNSFLVDENGNYVLDENGNNISVLDVPIDGDATLRQILEKIGAQEDVFLSISVLLSLATDNAKELVLEKINATPDLMGMYIYLLFRGATFADSAKFMTSPIMSLIKEKAKSNIFVSGEADNNIEYSINYYLKGPQLGRYIPEKYISSFRNA